MTDAHPLLLGLLVELPAPGEQWTRERRDQWLDVMHKSIDFLYPAKEPLQLPPARPGVVDAVRQAVDEAPPDATGPQLAKRIRAAAALEDPQPEPETPPRAAEWKPPTSVTDLVPCKIPGCPNTAPRRGRFAGRCTDHRGQPLPKAAAKDGPLAAPAGAEAEVERLLAEHRPQARAIAAHFYAAGLDRDDLEQEAMIGLRKAIRDYKPSAGTAFKTFADLCIRRQVITAVKTAHRAKHGPLNDAARLEKPIADDPDGATLGDAITNGHSPDPLQILITKEELEHLSELVQTRLTSLERRCVLMRANGVTYQQIAATIGEPEKTVDNALQRAREKLSEPVTATPPQCPRCTMPDRVEASISKPGGYWCDRCSLAFTPSVVAA